VVVESLANRVCFYELIVSLRERGVTIFLTTHPLEEPEGLCHRVAILNTTRRRVGRPDELRQRLFNQTPEVRVRGPLNNPDQVFRPSGRGRGAGSSSGGYELAVSDPEGG